MTEKKPRRKSPDPDRKVRRKNLDRTFDKIADAIEDNEDNHGQDYDPAPVLRRNGDRIEITADDIWGGWAQW